MTTPTTEPEDPNIDVNSAKPPKGEQLFQWVEWVRAKHIRAAKARGLEGQIIAVLGMIIGDPNLAPTNPYLPRKTGDLTLLRGTVVRGDEVAKLDDPRGWTVQGNDLVELWRGTLYANVITLVRIDLEIAGSHLPVIPHGFDREPMALEELTINRVKVWDRDAQGMAKYLLSLACDWGDWSSLPWSEFVAGFSTADEITIGSVALRQLQELDLLRLELREAVPYQIHFLPAFADIFLRPEA